MDKYGKTPYDIAKTKGFKNICELFESAHPKQMKNKKREILKHSMQTKKNSLATKNELTMILYLF